MRITILLVIFVGLLIYISSMPSHPVWINAGDFLNHNAGK